MTQKQTLINRLIFGTTFVVTSRQEYIVYYTMKTKTADQESQTTMRTPEMEKCLLRSKELLKIYQRLNTPEAHENFKKAERQRFRHYYTENKEKERDRSKRNQNLGKEKEKEKKLMKLL